ncbi:hypothetical protein AAF712_009906 [Marasmius tenuissimus]|uniref:Uncharacterized protein n=1 Tax=Marasmius tenuissimus TaxID=585030 RepID=A0ABR2ZPD9_9AGAR
MDGNDSLKRVERWEAPEEDGKLGRVKERPDNREGGGDYFLSVEEVDAWDRPNWKNLPGYEETAPEGTKRTPCEEKWDNMKSGHISKEKELLKETGIFAAACRHSFVLWVADMIKSGEAYVQRSNAGVLEELKALGVQSGDDVYSWIREEREYLESRHETPEDDINVIKLYKKLVLLEECRARIAAGRSVFISHMDTNSQSTLDLERSVRQAQETELTLLGEIHFYETQMKVDKRWEEGSDEWNRAMAMAEMKDYQGAIDKLEALVVARIFELSKMHMAGTDEATPGQGAQNSIRSYQNCSSKGQPGRRTTHPPPRDPLDYDDIVDKTYLADLDFLRETRNDVRQKIWAKPHVRELTANYFKLWKSHVELDRLHVEIKRLVMYMKEERNFLKAREIQVSQYDPHLAHQITIYRWERARFNDLHRTRLRNIYKLEGFDHSNIKFFIPGIGLKRQSDEDWEEVEDNLGKEKSGEEGNWEDDGEDDEDDDNEESVAVDAIAAVLGVAYDPVS